jgi:hypothetical protein
MRKPIRRVLGVILPVLVAATVQCADDSTGPPPGAGTLSVTIVGPAVVEGAALLEVDGGNVTAVSAPAGTVLTDRSGGRLRVALLLATPGILRLDVSVADTTKGIDAVLLEVADSLNALRPSLGSYAVAVSR